MHIDDVETRKKDLCKVCLYPCFGDCPAIYYNVEFYGILAAECLRGNVKQCDLFDLDKEEL